VMIQHSALLNLVHFSCHQHRFMSDDRYAAHSSFCFDASLEDIFPILSVGGQLHIMPERVNSDLDTIRDFIVEREITRVGFTTSLGVMMLQHFPDLKLRSMWLGGEKLYPVKKSLIQLWDLYGPTECTVYCVTHLVNPARDEVDVPIGRPVSNLSCFILSPEGLLLPAGAVGELCVAGPQLSCGYLKRDELTADRFVDCPFLPGEKMYRTGDLCRWNSDGNIEYLGRSDGQAKIRGYRVELGEIESVAIKMDGVDSVAAVFADESLRLYWCGAAGESEIRKFLSEQLEGYKVPSLYMHLEQMPLSSNDKVDKSRLPDIVFQTEYVAPETDLERIMCRVFENVLGAERIGVKDRLTMSGLNSLLAMKASLMLNQNDIKLSVGDIVRSNDIREISERILQKNDGRVYWLDDYDPTRETVIWSSGVTTRYVAENTLALLRERFNVLFLEPVYLAWANVDRMSLDGVVSGYLAEIKELVPDGCAIRSLIGHSFGGEIAYHLACRMARRDQIQPDVILFDTYISSRSESGDDMLHDIARRLGHLPLEKYPGQVCLISASKGSESAADNVSVWRNVMPEIKVIAVNDDHFGILRNPPAEIFEFLW